ncbi:hypothetical protein E4U46_006914 [Claviceps purpurea]|nr:hypothetical protein E4U46_006914 [Claviceps purpurea]
MARAAVDPQHETHLEARPIPHPSQARDYKSTTPPPSPSPLATRHALNLTSTTFPPSLLLQTRPALPRSHTPHAPRRAAPSRLPASPPPDGPPPDPLRPLRLDLHLFLERIFLPAIAT